MDLHEKTERLAKTFGNHGQAALVTMHGDTVRLASASLRELAARPARGRGRVQENSDVGPIIPMKAQDQEYRADSSLEKAAAFLEELAKLDPGMGIGEAKPTLNHKRFTGRSFSSLSSELEQTWAGIRHYQTERSICYGITTRRLKKMAFFS